MTRLLVLAFALFVVVVTGLVGSVVLGDSPEILAPFIDQFTRPTEPVDSTDNRQETFTVAPGASATEIGDGLKKARLIRAALAFRLVVERQGAGNTLAAGDYELRRSMSTEEIVQVLARGAVRRGLVVTIPEGWRAEQIAERLDATGFASGDEFLRAVATASDLPAALSLSEDARSSTVEGYLFPDTYEVKQRVTGQEAANLMVQRYVERVGPLIRGDLPAGLSQRDVVILASIVEREAQQPTERSTIASVYLNRLTAGMLLQADPTVQYALATLDGSRASTYGYWKHELSTLDLQVESPFNTYQRPGFPPAAICNPGDASIRAVLAPEQTDYRYFVATGDGGHLFARTLAEHNANIARISAQRP